MPFNPSTGTFNRIWQFVDHNQAGDQVKRSELDIALDDLARGVQGALKSFLGMINIVGGWAASTPFPTARPDRKPIKAHDTWIVTSAGNTGGITFEVNDMLFAIVDNPSSSYDGNWLRVPQTADIQGFALAAEEAANLAVMTAQGMVGAAKYSSIGDGTLNPRTLPATPASTAAYDLLIDGVEQSRSSYILSGATVTPLQPWPLGAELVDKVSTRLGEQTAQPSLIFTTRADFVTWLAAPHTPATGSRIDAGGYSYLFTGVGTILPGLPGCVPFGGYAAPHWDCDLTGTTSAIPAVSAMLDYVNAIGGGKALLPAGTYLWAGSLAKQGLNKVILEGEGNATKILRSGNRATALRFWGGANNRIRRLLIDCAGYSGRGIHLQDQWSGIEDCEVNNCPDRPFGLQGGGNTTYGLDSAGRSSDDAGFTTATFFPIGCYVENVRANRAGNTAISQKQMPHSRIQRCVVQNAYSEGITVDRCDYSVVSSNTLLNVSLIDTHQFPDLDAGTGWLSAGGGGVGGIGIDGSTGARVTKNTIIGVQTTTATRNNRSRAAINVVNNIQAANGCQIEGNHIVDAKVGIWLKGTGSGAAGNSFRHMITGNVFDSIGTAAGTGTAQFGAVWIDAGCTGNSLADNGQIGGGLLVTDQDGGNKLGDQDPLTLRPITAFVWAQSNGVGFSLASDGDKTLDPDVFLLNADLSGSTITPGTQFLPAAFGTAPLNIGTPGAEANSAYFSLGKRLREKHGRRVYIVVLAAGGHHIEAFLKPATITANGWAKVGGEQDISALMYPGLANALALVPGAPTSFDYIVGIQGEADQAKQPELYAAQATALITDLGSLVSAATVIVQPNIADSYGNANRARFANALIRAQHDLPALRIANTTGLTLASLGGIHYSGQGLVDLGYRLADAALSPPVRVDYRTEPVQLSPDAGMRSMTVQTGQTDIAQRFPVVASALGLSLENNATLGWAHRTSPNTAVPVVSRRIDRIGASDLGIVAFDAITTDSGATIDMRLTAAQFDASGAYMSLKNFTPTVSVLTPALGRTTFQGTFAKAGSGVAADVTLDAGCEFVALGYTIGLGSDDETCAFVVTAMEIVSAQPDQQDFYTRPTFVTWATGRNVPVGTVKRVAGFSYQFIGFVTSVIADLPGWLPFGAGNQAHWGGATTTTTFTASVAWMLAAGQMIEAFQFLHPTDAAIVPTGATAGQTASRVAGNIQAMMDAVMAWWNAAAGRSVNINWAGGMWNISDEVFSETFAAALYGMGSSRSTNRFSMIFNGTTFWAGSFAAQSAVRTSGFYAEKSITYPVPKVVLRWEQKNFNSYLSVFGTHKILGNRNPAVDPIGWKLLRAGQLKFNNPTVTNLANINIMIENVFNSDIYNPICLAGGYQPTECGGTGLISATARFSNVGATVTSTEAIFDAAMVGKYFSITNAGATPLGSAQPLTFQSIVASFVDANTIILTDVPPVNVTGENGSFAEIRISTTAGSTAATLSAPVSQSLVGKYVTLPTAGDNVATDNTFAWLTTVVTAHSGTSVTLANAARFTTTNGPIIVSPALLITRNPHIPTGGGTTDDVTVFNGQFENGGTTTGSSVPIACNAASSVSFVDNKGHGANITQNNFGGAFCAAAWGWTHGVKFDGTMTHGLQSPYFGKQIATGGEIQVDLSGTSLAYPGATKSSEIYIDTCTATPNLTAFTFGMAVQYQLDPSQKFDRYGAYGNNTMLRGSGSSPKGFGNTPVAMTYLDSLTVGGVVFGGNNTIPSGTLALAIGSVSMATNTVPTASGTFTSTVPPPGLYSLIIRTSGTTSYTMAFGAGFKNSANLVTGTVTAKSYSLLFYSDGAGLIELNRTAAY